MVSPVVERGNTGLREAQLITGEQSSFDKWCKWGWDLMTIQTIAFTALSFLAIGLATAYYYKKWPFSASQSGSTAASGGLVSRAEVQEDKGKEEALYQKILQEIANRFRGKGASGGTLLEDLQNINNSYSGESELQQEQLARLIANVVPNFQGSDKELCEKLIERSKKIPKIEKQTIKYLNRQAVVTAILRGSGKSAAALGSVIMEIAQHFINKSK